MYFTGVTLNIISLSGLALGVGMLVDNSIVVIENIYRLRSEGVPAHKAAVRGRKPGGGRDLRLHPHHGLRLFAHRLHPGHLPRSCLPTWA